MEDTVALTIPEREKQGELEVEISHGGEADLHKHLKGCLKNPDHLKFVPADQFNMDHFPPGCRDKDLLELVQSLSDLTVRVSVKYVSERRPEFDPNTGKPYPFYDKRGTDVQRYGTGWVYFVDKYPNENGLYTNCFCKECLVSPTPRVCECDECLEHDAPKTCQCHECLNSSTPKTRFAHIVMLTAVHVVYDDLEGAQTTCHLFFNNGIKPEKCKDCVALSGMFRVRSFDDRDWCEMTFVTHDMDLADKLEKMYERWELITELIEDKYQPLLSETKPPSSSSAALLPDDLKTLTVIVSHPHGCSKQVSVGSYTHREVRVRDKRDIDDDEYDMVCYTYTTPSCPGSSGAPVYVLTKSWCGMYDTHVHSGAWGGSTDNQSNYSCFEGEIVRENSGVLD